MAASASDLKERVKDIVMCSVCLEEFKNPRSLPCLHTFCSKCIKDFTASQQLQAGSLECPICREKFTLGDKGVDGLPRNFFIVDLLDAKKVAKDGSEHAQCEVCCSENGSSPEGVQATVYCAECSQYLCERCSLPHKRWKGGGHQILSLEEVKSGSRPTRSTSSYCEKDPEETVKMYCMDCKTNICVVCFATEHQHHQCKKIDVMAEEVGPQMDIDVDQVSQHVSEIQSRLHQLELSSTEFNKRMDEMETSVKQKAAEMKQLIDHQLNEILDQLQTVKHQVIKDILSLQQNLDMSLVAIESFTAYSKELRNKGKPCDISKAAAGLHSRAVELQNMSLASVDNCIPNVVFIPADHLKISRMPGTVPSFIGEIVVTKYSSAPQLKHVLPTEEPVWGLASLDDCLYVLRSRSAEQVEVYGIPDYMFQCHRFIPKLDGLSDMAASIKDRCLYLVDCVAKCVKAVNDDYSITWPVNDNPWGISITSSNDILITCDEACKLKIFSPIGKLLREIPLYPNITNPCHAVETVDGNFVVCYGAEMDPFRCVCLINADGRAIITYCGGSAGQMTKPCHLAVDEDGFVFVADANGMVQMLSPGLGFMWDVASTGNSLSGKPWRLSVDRQRLCVADNKCFDGKWTVGRVVIFEL